jgi:hypothetical protein
MGFGFWRIIGCAALVIAGSGDALAQPNVSISDTQVVEGNSGTTNAQFVVTLSAPYSNTTAVAYQTFEYSTSFYQPYSARSGVDFIATNGIVMFEPGQTNKSVFVRVIGDTINEANEPFGIGLTMQGPGTLDRYNATCLILDDDPLQISLSDSVVVEGGAGETSYAQFTATMYQPTEQVVYCQASLSAGTATAGVDYLVGPISWELDPGPPRTNVFCCSVPINGDSTNEDDETFFLTPSLGFGHFAVMPHDTNPQNARGVTFLNQAKCTIVNDDFYLSVQPGANPRQVTLVGAQGAAHVLQSSSNLVNWTSFSTNTLGPERQVSVVVTNTANRFFRAWRMVNLQ